MNAPMNDRYHRRFQDPRQWPSQVVFGLYAEVKTEKAVNELSWEWAGNQVAAEASAWVDAPGLGDEVEAALRAETARQERWATAQTEGWAVGGDPGE